MFSKGGAKSGEICFLPLEIEKTTFFANNFKIHGGTGPMPPLPKPMLKRITADFCKNDTNDFCQDAFEYILDVFKRNEALTIILRI